MDIDSIPPGADFVEILEHWVGECEVMLALIGPGWIGATDPKTGRRRLDSQYDFVRIEIREALRRGIPVVPVLLDGAPMPDDDELPDDLKRLVRRQAEFVQFHTFDADVARLMRRLKVASEPIETEARRPRDAEAKRKADEQVRDLPEGMEAGSRRRRNSEGKRRADQEARVPNEPPGTEARGQRDAEAKRRAEEEQFRAAGRIPVQIGDRNQNKTQWMLPGAGEPFCDIPRLNEDSGEIACLWWPDGFRWGA